MEIVAGRVDIAGLVFWVPNWYLYRERRFVTRAKAVWYGLVYSADVKDGRATSVEYSGYDY